MNLRLRKKYKHGNRDGRNKTYLAYALYFISVILICAALATYVTHTRAKQSSENIAKHALEEANRPGGGTSENPSTNKPSEDAIATYKTLPSLPRIISIPKINATARIMSAGLNAKSEIVAPDNIFDTTWYNRSSLPGNGGSMIIAGHVSSWSHSGIFYKLKDLRPGDEITIERGDGRQYVYQVAKTVQYDIDQINMNEVLTPVDKNVPGLNLITCTGKVIKGTNNFDKRLVVFAKQVNVIN